MQQTLLLGDLTAKDDWTNRFLKNVSDNKIKGKSAFDGQERCRLN